MHLTKPKWFLFVLSLGVIGGTAGVTLGLLTLAGITFRGEGSAQSGSGSTRVEGPLFTANRDRLALCVQAVGTPPAVQATAQATIVSAIDDLTKRADWPASFTLAPPQVDAGCPSNAAALAPGVHLTSSKFNTRFVVEPLPVVKEASYYRVFVFILPRPTLDSVFGTGYAKATQEFLKNGDDFTGVTSGIYIAPAQVEDTAFLASLLAYTLGLAPQPPALAALLPAAGDDGSESQYVGGALLTSNRDRLAICVAATGANIDGSIEDAAVLSVQQAIDKAATNPSWIEIGLADRAPAVDPKCPSTPAVFLPGAGLTGTGKFGLLVDMAAAEVQEASYYRVFVFIVSPEELASTFGDEFPIATQEWLRHSLHQWTPVTLGLYVTPSQATKPDFISGWLLFMIGGVRVPPATETPAPSAQLYVHVRVV